MCKLSLNIVPNVYNSLQSSFLSLAWPWPGRSLLKGNQWEWWVPEQGPLPGLGEVGHSPRGTSGMWLGSQSTCHPNAPPDAPYKPPIPLLALNTYTPCQLPNAPLTLPDDPLTCPTSPTLLPIPCWPQALMVPANPKCTCWPLMAYTSCQPPNAPLPAPWHPLTPASAGI